MNGGKRSRDYRKLATAVAAAKATLRGSFAHAWLLLALACLCGGAAPAAAQTVAPPNTVFKAGVVYGLANGSSVIGGGYAAGGHFGNANGSGKLLFEVVTTNTTGIGSQLFVFRGNGDGSFSLQPPAGYDFINPTQYIQEGLNLILAGPVVSPTSADLVVTDDGNNLYLLKGNGDGTFQTPVSLGQTASSLASYMNSSGTLNLVTSTLVFPTPTTYHAEVNLLTNNNDGTGSFTAQSVSGPASSVVNSATALVAGGYTALLVVYADGTAGLAQVVGGTLQAPVSLGTMGTPNGVGSEPISVFTSQGSTFFAGIGLAGVSGVPTTFIWPVTSSGGAISVGTPTTYNVPTNDAALVTTGDLDGDGKPDLIVLGGGQYSTTRTVNLFLSNSTPGFSPGASQAKPNQTIGPGVYGTQAIVGDANGDGNNDLILYQPNQGLTVLLNQGNGTFLTPPTYAAGNRPVAIAKADFNGDGLDDLVVANGFNYSTQTSDNTVSVFVSTAPGSYTPAQGSPFAVGGDPIGLATGMVNGFQSIFVLSLADTSGNSSNPQVAFLQGNGDGTFKPPVYFSTGTNVSSGAQPSAIATGAFDTSGNATVAVANTDGTINLFTYQSGAFTQVANGLSVSGAPGYGLNISSLAVGDVNNDGNMDLVATFTGHCGYNSTTQYVEMGGAVYIFPGNGDGTFQVPVTVTSTLPNAAPVFTALGSFGGSGSSAGPDLLVVLGGSGGCSSYGPGLVDFVNLGGLAFSETDLPDPLGAGEAAIADVNGDGFNDIVLSAGGLVSVLQNNGNGTFAPPTFYVGSSDSAGLVAGSFFGPGGHDAALASSVGATVIQSLSAAPTGPAFAKYSNIGPIDFGVVNVNSSSTQSLTLMNTGGAPFMVNSVTLQGSSSAFSVTNVVCNGNPVSLPFSSPITLGAEGTCTFTLQFAPTLPGTGQAELLTVATTTTNSNASAGPGGAGQAFLLLGEGLGPYASFSPSSSSFDFGPVLVGQSPTYTITLTNTGTGPLAFSGISFGLTTSPGFSFSSTCTVPSTINPGDSCTATVQFAPMYPGASAVSLAFGDNARPGESNLASITGNPFYQVISFTGTGVAPPQIASVTPNFGAQGQQNLQVTITGMNFVAGLTTVTFGGGNVGIAVASLTVNSATSATAVLNILPTTLPGNYDVVVTVNGAPPPATLTGGFTVAVPVPTDNEPITVNDQVTVTPLISVAAPVAYFSDGSIGFGGQSGSQTVTLSNIGLAALTLVSATASAGSPFAVTQVTCSNGATSASTTLPSGGACTLTVTYTPSATPANDTDNVVFTDSAALSNLTSTVAGASFTQSISLSGSGSTTAPPPPPPATVTIPTISETITVNDHFGLSVTTLTSSISSAILGVPITLTAGVQAAASGNPSPTGTVTFFDGSVPLISTSTHPNPVTLVNGMASYTTSLLAVGIHPLTAVYSGDTNFPSSSSPVLVETISMPGDFSLSANPASLTIPQGQSGTTTITVTPLGSGIGTIGRQLTLSCPVLPSYAACVFTPSTVTLYGSVLTVNLRIYTTGLNGVGSVGRPPEEWVDLQNRRPGRIPPMLPAAMLLLIGMLALAARQQNEKKLGARLALIVLLAGMGILTACYHYGTPILPGTPFTPTGQSNVLVKVSGDGTAQTLNLPVNITPAQ